MLDTAKSVRVTPSISAARSKVSFCSGLIRASIRAARSDLRCTAEPGIGFSYLLCEYCTANCRTRQGRSHLQFSAHPTSLLPHLNLDSISLNYHNDWERTD